MKTHSKVIMVGLLVCTLVLQLPILDQHLRQLPRGHGSRTSPEPQNGDAPSQDTSIYITSDDRWRDNGASGTGTEANPYVIEGRSISRSDECVTIRNTRAHFVIRYCTFETSNAYDTCMLLVNVSNGQIVDCSITSQSWHGIRLEDSSSMEIDEVTINAAEDGAFIENSNRTIVRNSNIYAGVNGVVLDKSTECEIADNLFFGGGILIDDYLEPYSASHWNHSLDGNLVWGKPIGYFRGIRDITLNGSDYAQLFVYDSTNFSVQGGVFENPTGFDVVNCSDAEIANVTTLNTRRDGTLIGCVNATVDNCTLWETYWGLTLRDCINCTVSRIQASDHDSDSYSSYGFSFVNCTQCSGIDNRIYNRGELAVVRDSNDCLVVHCNSTDCSCGFSITTSSRINITMNTVNAEAGGFSSGQCALRIYESVGVVVNANSIRALVTHEAVAVERSVNTSLCGNEILGALAFDSSSFIVCDDNNITSPEPTRLSVSYDSHDYQVTNNRLVNVSFAINLWNCEKWTFNLVNNTVDGAPVLFVQNEAGKDFTGVSFPQAFIIDSEDITIGNTAVEGVAVGITVFNSTLLLKDVNISQCPSRTLDAYRSSVHIQNCKFTGNMYTCEITYCEDCSIKDSFLSGIYIFNGTSFMVNNTSILSTYYTTFYAGQLKDSVIAYCNVSGSDNDLLLSASSNVTISSNSFLGGSSVSLYNCVDLTIVDNSLGDSRLYVESGAAKAEWMHTIENNTMNAGLLGYLVGLEDETVSIDGYAQLFIVNCSRVDVVGTTGGPVYGIVMAASEHCTISGISLGVPNEMRIVSSADVDVLNCEFAGGLRVAYSSDCSVRECSIPESWMYAGSCPNLTVSDCEMIGSHLQAIGADGIRIDGLTISDDEYETLLLLGSDNAVLANIRSTGGYRGITCDSCWNITADNLLVADATYGIYVFYCDNVTLRNSYILDSIEWGLGLINTGNGLIMGNRIYDSGEYGILLIDCEDLTLSANALGWNGFANALDGDGQNNTWDGNYWSLLENETQHEIDGTTGSVDHDPFRLEARDFGPPTISHNEDTFFWVDDAEAVLSWEASDENPAVYRLYVNGTLTEESPWTSTTISIDFTEYEVGVYNLSLRVYDIFGDYATDNVVVEIRGSEGRESPVILWEYVVAAGGVSASFVVAAVLLAKRRVAKAEVAD